MRWNEILRSSAFRRAIFFALAVAVANAAVFAFVYLDISDWAVQHLTNVLTSEVARSAGMSADQLRQDLDLRLTQDLRHVDYAALFDAQGKLIYGNMKELPKTVSVDGKAHYVEVPGLAAPHSRNEPGIFVAGPIRGGGILLLGRSLYSVNTLRRTVLTSLGLAIVPTVILVFVIGVFFSLRAMRRLKSIHQTIDHILDGNFQSRLPLEGRADEIDDVNAAVNRMLDEILRLLKQIKAVGDNIAHDLRTPLAVVSARLNRVLAEGDDQELQEAVKQSLADLDKAITTVAALLRISEIENWSRRSAFEDVDVADICAEVSEFYAPLAEARSIMLTAEVEKPVFVHGDADLLREALLNLVDNAIKFTPKGGLVQIAAKMSEQGPVIRVADNGPGIAAAEREKVLKRFYRSPDVRNIPGNGLGLSMVATIAELHGLRLRVGDNRPGAVIELGPCPEAKSPASLGVPVAEKRFRPFAKKGHFFDDQTKSRGQSIPELRKYPRRSNHPSA
ncbi:MAG: sensor histidine kinase [Beijerinckiaceae bacterium]